MSNTALAFGISCLHYGWDTIAQAFTRARDEFGIEAIEFSTNRMEPGDYAECKRVAADMGMTADLHAWDNLAADVAAGKDAMDRSLDLSVEAGIRFLVAHMGSHPSREQGIENVVEVCAAVAPAYEDAGVTICLENHYLYEYEGKNEIGGEPCDFRPVFAAVDSPAVKLILDYGHSHMCRNTTAFIDELKDQLVYTHIADNMGEHDDHMAWPDGTVDWEKEIGHTLRVGFRGPFAIEFPERKCSAERFREFVAFVRQRDAAEN